MRLPIYQILYDNNNILKSTHKIKINKKIFNTHIIYIDQLKKVNSKSYLRI